ncbi:tetratricopeptide repeat-containing protein [Striga asiatica]|uniref:Tetratricopeptide repeat-containing protein n=1 Tax=Striga asiatica TaxID=4170 RepID=A0A5A7PL78_STRAF|nr:tetratricopeptide repeat-containing protein [Striga asiatica]
MERTDLEEEDPEKALSFAKEHLDSGNMLSLPIAMTLQLLGSSSFDLKMFNNSLGYLIRANRVLAKPTEGRFMDRAMDSATEASIANWARLIQSIFSLFDYSIFCKPGAECYLC